ncbi:MAG: alpha-glucan family phosphorylase [Acidimicrobiales bacterium]|nr:alpha-glucan family phosphorylase [Acidimicrobiales bacterium]
MRALRSFTVRPRLPEALHHLEQLAMNLRWSWDESTRALFRWVDPEAWDSTVHDPVRLLGLVRRERLDALATDAGFLRYLNEVHDGLVRYLERPRWFQTTADAGELRLVGYFSPEFGMSEALPQYSGGLGVLAGDHLKAASDLGVPLVGIGLFYRHGYFRQALSADGWQLERYPDLDPHAMALTPCDGVQVELDLAGEPVLARVWRADVGRIPLYLLDTDVEENSEAARGVTDRLYGGDSEHRLRQEIVLGVGGVRALEALGHDVQVFHTNEGHAGFLGLERIRRFMVDEGLSFHEAIEAVRAGNIFTTHTPVPAGIDRFRPELIERYFGWWADETGVPLPELLALGRRDEEPPDDRFNMAVMGLRLAGRSNAVARLHGDVSRAMFRDLWPDAPEAEVPITHITNGVHAHTWVSPEIDDVLARHVLPEWAGAGPGDWARIDTARDDEIWRAREQGRERLVSLVRQRLRQAAEARGLSPSDTAWCAEVLDPKILTVGFARRFATYKRATLLLSQPERLRALLLSPDRPVQLVFAGKAHPADDAGKEMISRIVHFASDPEVRHRIAFVEDYDIALARGLYQGADVWLNTPRRPLEACGTSGMKSALNGGLQLSILDGWWAEMFNGDNGWAISSVEAEHDPDRRDELEANSLFDLLEQQIAPLFYRRDEGPVPRAWVRRVKASLASLGPRVTATRMVRDYVEELYQTTAARADRLGGDGHLRARALAGWKDRVGRAWRGVHVVAVDADETPAELGATRRVDAVVALGSLSAADVAVQLVHGTVGQGGELTMATVREMEAVGPPTAGQLRYRGEVPCERAGRYGFTVRVVPSHPDLTGPVELGRIAWA